MWSMHLHGSGNLFKSVPSRYNPTFFQGWFLIGSRWFDSTHSHDSAQLTSVQTVLYQLDYCRVNGACVLLSYCKSDETTELKVKITDIS